jgi:hypothetical protein
VVPPTAPKPPVPAVTTPAIAPAPLATESKKETAKVPASSPGTKPAVPQATVQMQKKPAASASKSVPPGAAITVAPASETPAGGDVSPAIGGLALAASLVAMGIQVWMML